MKKCSYWRTLIGLLLSIAMTVVSPYLAYAESRPHDSCAVIFSATTESGPHLFQNRNQASTLLQTLIEEARRNPYSVYFAATVQIDDHFKPVLDDVRYLTNFLLEDPTDMSAVGEMIETKAAIAKVRETHAAIEATIKPQLMKRLLFSWSASDIADRVAELTTEIQNCHAHTQVCAAHIRPKIAQLEAHVVRVSKLRDELSSTSKELSALKTEIAAARLPPQTEKDLNDVIDKKVDAIETEITVLNQHLGLVRVKIRAATDVYTSAAAMDTLTEAAKNLGRPYIDNRQTMRDEIAKRTKEEIISLEDQQIMKKFADASHKKDRPVWPRRELRALVRVNNYRAVNLALDAYNAFGGNATPRMLTDLKFILAGRRLTLENRDSLNRFMKHAQSLDSVNTIAKTNWLVENCFSHYADEETTTLMLKLRDQFVVTWRRPDDFADRHLTDRHLDILKEEFFDEKYWINDSVSFLYDRIKILKIISHVQTEASVKFLQEIASGSWTAASPEMETALGISLIHYAPNRTPEAIRAEGEAAARSNHNEVTQAARNLLEGRPQAQ